MIYFGITLKGLAVVGLWFLVVFLIWRKFRLDIEERQILNFGLGLFLLMVGYVMGVKIWIISLGLVIELIYFAKKNNWDSFEVGDYLILVLAFFVGMSTWSFLLIWLFGLFISKTFRKIKWYKSGKPGAILLLVYAIFGVWLVWEGKNTSLIDQIAGIWLLTGSLVWLYLRSGLKLIK